MAHRVDCTTARSTIFGSKYVNSRARLMYLGGNGYYWSAEAVEEVGEADSLQGGPVNPLVYSDMALTKYLCGGAVFSTGSIQWSGNLLTTNDTTVSQVTQNVLQRFDSPEPLP
jgi:hypothetical protein